MSVQIEEFLGTELNRNKANADVYEKFLRLAFPGENLSVLIGHHICLEFDKDLQTENEIPAADTLLFDPVLSEKVFGQNYKDILPALALLPIAARDAKFRELVNSEYEQRNEIHWPAPIQSYDL